jgi:hypothetical protein
MVITAQYMPKLYNEDQLSLREGAPRILRRRLGNAVFEVYGGEHNKFGIEIREYGRKDLSR